LKESTPSITSMAASFFDDDDTLSFGRSSQQTPSQLAGGLMNYISKKMEQISGFDFWG
jgi:hypothetical protein